MQTPDNHFFFSIVMPQMESEMDKLSHRKKIFPQAHLHTVSFEDLEIYYGNVHTKTFTILAVFLQIVLVLS